MIGVNLCICMCVFVFVYLYLCVCICVFVFVYFHLCSSEDDLRKSKQWLAALGIGKTQETAFYFCQVLVSLPFKFR